MLRAFSSVVRTPCEPTKLRRIFPVPTAVSADERSHWHKGSARHKYVPAPFERRAAFNNSGLAEPLWSCRAPHSKATPAATGKPPRSQATRAHPATPAFPATSLGLRNIPVPTIVPRTMETAAAGPRARIRLGGEPCSTSRSLAFPARQLRTVLSTRDRSRGVSVSHQ